MRTLPRRLVRVFQTHNPASHLRLPQGVEHEQHHLQLRSTRHLKTVKSTHRRTLAYYCAIYLAIILTSVVQVHC